MISRRTLLGALAALPLLPGAAGAQGRVAGARIALRDDRMWIEVRFGTRGPFTFIIDTGASMNLIRRDVARQLGLKELGATQLAGTGGREQLTVYEAPDVAFGNVGIGTVRFGAYGSEMSIHPEAAGALSADMLTVADADLDFDAGEWRIYPDGRGDRAGYVQLPSEIRRSVTQSGAASIFVDATFGGQNLRLEVDTGAPGGLRLSSEAVRRSGLWNGTTPFVPSHSRGIGGVGARSRLVRGGEVRIGAVRVEAPVVALIDPDARSDVGNLIGIQLLQQMNLSTDIKAGRLWARRNARPVPAPHYNMSGLWAEEKDGRLRVAEISPASPAAEAGLRPGDELTGRTMHEWLDAATGASGQTLAVEYHRGGEARTAKLVLRPYL
jgi:serine protease Do